jgi:2-isopropylmalate synthase
VSFHADGHEPRVDPWITAGVSSDLNQAALMAIVDGFHYWLLKKAAEAEAAAGETAPVSAEMA